MKQAEYQPVDMKYIDMLTDGDPGELQVLFQIFKSQMDISIVKLKNSFINQDDEMWCRVAHQMKGAAASFGANDLSEVCKAAEHDGTSTLSRKNAHLKSITSYLDEVMVFISGRIK